MILIYSKDVDDFVNQVIDCLDEDFIRIGGSSDEMLVDDIHINDNKINFKIHNKFFPPYNVEKVKCIWFNGGYVHTDGNNYENECYEMLVNSFLNHKDSYKIGRLRSDFEINKLDAPLEAKKHGFKIPETLVTSNKDNLIEFYNKYHAQNGIICKRITDTLFYRDNDYTYDFTATFLIDSDALLDIPKEFAISLFQERIIADYEIRVVFIKGHFYAMSIHTFNNDVDYRSTLDYSKKIRTVPYKLPLDIEEKLKNIFASFNLNYGSIDLMYSNNSYYFLEINPTGQISFVNNACNFYIENTLSNLLRNET